MSKRNLNGEFLDRDRLLDLGFAALGQNVLIHPSVVLINCAGIKLGSNVRIDAFTLISVSKGITIGSNVHIGSHCSLIGSEEIEIGDFGNVSHGCRLFSASDDFSGAAMAGSMAPADMRDVEEGPVRIGRHGGLGASCVVLPGVEIGEGTCVAAMTLLRRSLPPWGIFGGTPVRRIGPRKDNVLALEEAYHRRCAQTQGETG